MPSWTDSLKDTLHDAAHNAEQRIDAVRRALRERMGTRRPVYVLPYRGFGTPQSLQVRGRVLAGQALEDPSPDARAWDNIAAMYRRFESDERPGVAVQATYGSATAEGLSDEEGYVDLALELGEPLESGEAWHDVLLSLPGASRNGDAPETATCRVLVPPVDSVYGIISDVDDTVLQTGAASLLSMIQTTLLGNARTRLAFKGVAGLYRALVHGPDGSRHNPLFFVSSSPWNLYDFLEDFFALNGIPEAPILLRDLGIDESKFIKTGHGHKLDKVRRIMATYPDLPFVLVGDSGQEDPELYRQAIAEHPGRIRVVYIRDVTEQARDSQVVRIAEEVARHGVEMLLVPDSAAAAEHAVANGLIPEETLADVRAEREKDEDA